MVIRQPVKAAVYISPARIEVQETPAPQLKPGDVLLRVRACGVCGTDIRKVRYQLVKAPAILGHEVAGDVAALGEGVTNFRVGDRVVVAHHTPCHACHYCRHGNVSMCRTFKTSNLDPGGFAEYVRIPASHVKMTAFKIPAEMSYDEAIFMEPLACVLRNFKRTTFLPGDTVLVIGLGSMGLLTGQVAKHRAGHVIGSDLKEERRALGRKLGFDAVLDGDMKRLESAVAEMTQGRGVDLVVLTAGGTKLYSEVSSLVRDGGSINIFAGLSPGERVSYDVNELYGRELTVYSSYSPSPTELHEALEHLRSGHVRTDILSSNSYPLGNLAQAIDACGNGDILKAIIRPEVAAL